MSSNYVEVGIQLPKAGFEWRRLKARSLFFFRGLVGSKVPGLTNIMEYFVKSYGTQLGTYQLCKGTFALERDSSHGRDWEGRRLAGPRRSAQMPWRELQRQCRSPVLRFWMLSDGHVKIGDLDPTDGFPLVSRKTSPREGFFSSFSQVSFAKHRRHREGWVAMLAQLAA